MIIKELQYTNLFEERFRKLSVDIQKKALKAESLFRQNPLHPSLRLHKLKGRLKDGWSISIDVKNRIIFRVMPDGVIVFSNIGSHAIYEE